MVILSRPLPVTPWRLLLFSLDERVCAGLPYSTHWTSCANGTFRSTRHQVHYHVFPSSDGVKTMTLRQDLTTRTCCHVSFRPFSYKTRIISRKYDGKYGCSAQYERKQQFTYRCGCSSTTIHSGFFPPRRYSLGIWPYTWPRGGDIFPVMLEEYKAAAEGGGGR